MTHEIYGPNACVICGNFPTMAYLLPQHESMTLNELAALRAAEEEEGYKCPDNDPNCPDCARGW